MNGAANWRRAAKALGVRYMFWGQDEKNELPIKQRPWEVTSFLVASGDWGAIYDLNTPAPQQLACDGCVGVDECLMEGRLSPYSEGMCKETK